MNYILDIIIIGVVLLSIVIGMKKGFVKMLLDFAGIVIALVVTYSLVNPVSDFVCENFVITPMARSVVNTLTSGDDSKDISLIISESPAFLDEVLESFDFPLGELRAVAENNKNVELSEKNILICKEIVRPAANSAAYTGSFIVLFVGCLVAVKFISKFAKFINKIPLIGSFNKGGGAILGLVSGLIAVFVIVNIAKAVSFTQIASDENFILNEKQIQNTMVFKHVYNFEIFDYILDFTKK
ncbi:MAG: CvpA family protein [Clostridia bacterium]|nr:CvpA family protein [Clostridia bacterium]